MLGREVWNMARTVAVLLLLGGCVTSEQQLARDKYYRDHPMEECKRFLADEDLHRSMQRAQASFQHKDPPTEAPIDPCALGCRIPVCGYPPAKTEAAP